MDSPSQEWSDTGSHSIALGDVSPTAASFSASLWPDKWAMVLGPMMHMDQEPSGRTNYRTCPVVPMQERKKNIQLMPYARMGLALTQPRNGWQLLSIAVCKYSSLKLEKAGQANGRLLSSLIVYNA